MLLDDVQTVIASTRKSRLNAVHIMRGYCYRKPLQSLNVFRKTERDNDATLLQFVLLKRREEKSVGFVTETRKLVWRELARRVIDKNIKSLLKPLNECRTKILSSFYLTL